MFTQKIIDSDAFLDMPLSSQALYFHLNMRADDDGFVNNPKRIQRTVGASEDDLKLLIVKRFVIGFDSGVIVIKHWKMHNTLRKDRYNPTQYQEELQTLALKENNSYTEKPVASLATTWQPTGSQPAAQYSIGKVSIDKDSIVESSVEHGDSDNAAECGKECGKLEAMHGKLGKGVVFLTENQIEDLLDKIGLDAFDRYVEKLADFIIEKNANVKNHYETILKWHTEDTGIKKSVTGFNDSNFSCLTKSNPKTVADDENIRARAEALRQQLSV
jgi:hypothetical protein